MKSSLLLCVFVGAIGAAPAYANPTLAKNKNCLGCHAVNETVLGPSFKAVAAKYAGDKAAADTLTKKVLKGGTGVWGANVMPPMETQVTAAEAKQLVSWILGTK